MSPRPKRPKISYSEQDGCWHAWVTVGTKPNGRPDQRHVKRATEAQVEERVDELLAQKQAGHVQRPGRVPTVEKLLTTYLDTTASLKIDPTTVDGYRSKMRCHVYPVIGKQPGNRLLPEHLEAVYLEMRRRGLADATILQVHRILARALKVLARRGAIPRNVAALIDPPTAKKQEKTPPDNATAYRLLAATELRRNSARWKVGLGLGYRQGEALGLRWSYIDLDSDEPQIKLWWQLHRRPFAHGCGTPPSCSRRRAGNCPHRWLPLRSGEIVLAGGLILKEPKGKSKRETPLPEELVEILRAHREVQSLEKMAAGPAYIDHDLVFAHLDGSPIDPSSDWDEWQELESEAGVSGQYRLHDGRHFAATLLLALGVDVRVVQEILGHSSVKVTEGYAHVPSPLARDATQRMGRSLFGKRDTP